MTAEVCDSVVPLIMVELQRNERGEAWRAYPQLADAIVSILADISMLRNKHDSELVVAVLAMMGRLHTVSDAAGGRRGEEALEDAVRAVQQNGLALEHTCGTARSCFRVVLEAVRQNGLALQFAEESLRGDKTITMTAVRQNGLALQYASAFMRNNGPVVMMAVKQDGRAIQYASENLRRCEDTVGAAVQQDVEAAWHAADATRKRRTEADYGPARAARRAERAARHHARNIYGPADPNI